MKNYRYADHLGRGVPMMCRKVKAMKGYSLELCEEDEQFRVVLHLPLQN